MKRIEEGDGKEVLTLDCPRHIIKEVAEQIDVLCRLFPELRSFPKKKIFKKSFSNGAEGLLVVPKWEKIAPTYNEAVEKVFHQIYMTRGSDTKHFMFGSGYLRRNERTEKMFRALGKKQKGNFLFVDAQFGLRHDGLSVEEVRKAFSEKEFGLGFFEVGIMLLTHPELQKIAWCMDCAGDDYSQDAGNAFLEVPSLSLWKGKLIIFKFSIKDHSRGCASVSGFLP
jgi:hypothetical protein